MARDIAYLNELTWGCRASRVLHVAALLKVFTQLADKPLACKELAAACGAKPDILGRVLIACCALGLLEKEGDAYRNTALSQEYLVDGKPLYKGNIIAHAARVWDYWHDLPRFILENPPQPDEARDHRNFILGMRDITMGGRGQVFLDNIDLSDRKKLFDVGGGPGLYCILACQKYPQLTATLFDLPATIAIARELVEEAGLTDRISLRGGSWETDDFGSGNDVVLFSNVLHGPGSMTDVKLQKAFESMVSGGLLTIQEFALNDDKTGPEIPALFNVMMGAYSKAELFDEITKAGFVNPQVATEAEEIGCTWITASKS
ncbi:MAG: methyltransferase [Phycisphaerae bacterium]|nr:methyltransferase [Phycisphaerae bacterium]